MLSFRLNYILYGLVEQVDRFLKLGEHCGVRHVCCQKTVVRKNNAHQTNQRTSNKLRTQTDILLCRLPDIVRAAFQTKYIVKSLSSKIGNKDFNRKSEL